MTKIKRRNLTTGTGNSRISVAAAPHFSFVQAEKILEISILPGAGSVGVPRQMKGSAELMNDGKGRYLVTSLISGHGPGTGGGSVAIGETFC
jgi:hypothetical protein